VYKSFDSRWRAPLTRASVVFEDCYSPSCSLGTVRQFCLSTNSTFSSVLTLPFFFSSVVANIIAGGVAEAGAQQAGDLMQDLKTGALLKASPRSQFYGQMIGSLASVFVSTGAYKLYTSVYEIPGELLSGRSDLECSSQADNMTAARS
jgi:uncharacterized oligopeptide transporter (OPT) family protein